MYVLTAVNALAALLSGASSIAGAVRPSLGLTTSEPVTSGMLLYARAYTARALPLSVVALVLLARQEWTVLAPFLIVLGLAQVGDSVLGAQRRNVGQAVGAGVGAVIHLVSAVWLYTH
ncbi:hypothetical protein [Actinoplanes ianthinogenes]|nr:hypothetical protein [Actinoplanes ianthinogenes]